jgi:hypothetical protein
MNVFKLILRGVIMAATIKVGWFQKFTVGASLVLKLAEAGADGKITADELLGIVGQSLKELGIDVVGRV